jgi:hypothetical protein
MEMLSPPPGAVNIRPTPKWQRVVLTLLTRPRLNRFEAERDPTIRDHCLPSTIAELERKGLRIERCLAKVPGYLGSTAIVAEYSLTDPQRLIAERLLERSANRGKP